MTSTSRVSRPYRNFWGHHRIGDGTTIAAFVEIGDKVLIGRNCKIEAFVFIPPGVVIGDNVFIGPHTCFTNHKHAKIMQEGFVPETTIVEDGVVIGAGCTILPSITLGKKCVVGAGSVVTHDVAPGITVVGNPARQLSISYHDAGLERE